MRGGVGRDQPERGPKVCSSLRRYANRDETIIDRYLLIGEIPRLHPAGVGISLETCNVLITPRLVLSAVIEFCLPGSAFLGPG